MLKDYKEITIPYWFGKQLVLCFYYRIGEKTRNKEFRVTIWKYRKMKDIPGYENKWGTKWWKHITLWKCRGKNDN